MMQIFDVKTGEYIRPVPPLVPMWEVVVKDSEYDARHYTERIRPEELDAFCETHDVQDAWEVQAPDPAWLLARREAETHVCATSCVMPSVEDLQLLAWAKALPPERFEEIDPEQGRWLMVRQRLNSIRSNKANERHALARNTP